MSYSQFQAEAKALDQQDELSALMTHFALPEGCIYLDGNSLGPLPKAAKQRALEVVEQQWGQDLITSWNKHEWINLPCKVGAKIAPLVGAQASQVIACDSISVNLTKLLCCALHIQNENTHLNKSPKRNLVISQKDNFPTDLYMVQGLTDLLGEQQCQLLSVDEEDILNAINTHGEQAAVLMLTHVNFRSGLIHNMQSLTEAAHSKGMLVIWDLAHSAGVLDVQLDACSVDFAVGCTYKYLNGGPGAPAFVYAAKRHWHHLKQPLSGWMGHKRPFAFTHDYEPGEAMQSFLVGTPPVVSMSILDAALDSFSALSAVQIRAKSLSLGSYFKKVFQALIGDSEFQLVSPEDPQIRGSQLAYAHPNAYEICQALIAEKVIADFRAPNILRIGFSPLFLSHQHMLDAVSIIKQVMDEKRYLEVQYQVKQAVT